MRSYSQVFQDVFALTLHPEPGYYVDFGCGDGMDDPNGGNTLLLEQNGWAGLLVDGNKELLEKAIVNRPKSKCVCAFLPDDSIPDILKNNNVPKVIDYLSIDTDPANSPTVKAFPFDEYEFKIATIEHDKCASGPVEQTIIYEYLKSVGYTRLCVDIPTFNTTYAFFEDWWVNKKYFEDDKIFFENRFNKVPGVEIIFQLKKDLGQM
jgi:hypothetical protein